MWTRPTGLIFEHCRPSTRRTKQTPHLKVRTGPHSDSLAPSSLSPVTCPPFRPRLEADAMSCGVDMSVQSTHKTGGSLTQTAMLHIHQSTYSLCAQALISPRVAAWSTLYVTRTPSHSVCTDAWSCAGVEVAHVEDTVQEIFSVLTSTSPSGKLLRLTNYFSTIVGCDS